MSKISKAGPRGKGLAGAGDVERGEQAQAAGARPWRALMGANQSPERPDLSPTCRAAPQINCSGRGSCRPAATWCPTRRG